MIITRTPYRISFVGGGSDLPSFYEKRQGAVISTTIDKYIYISSHDIFDEHTLRLKYSKMENVREPEEIRHPIFREVLTKYRPEGSVEINSIGDVPYGTGIGSSSSFTVGLLHNIHLQRGRMPSKRQLAEEACDIELNRLREPIGKQDQYAAAFGGLNLICFNPDETVTVEKIMTSRSFRRRLESSIVLIYTGVKRSASAVLEEQNKGLRSGATQTKQADLVEMVWEFKDALAAEDMAGMAGVIDKGWQVKRALASGISTPELEDIYSRAMANGALGGKLLGAGGGGFFMFIVEPEKRGAFCQAMHGFRHLKVHFDSQGSTAIFAEGNGDEHEC
jgi:D-glycero-alpha-D-manno-heptose-7-phosphate kinase